MNTYQQKRRRLTFKDILFNQSTPGFVQFFRYTIVGGISAVVDWGLFLLLTEGANLHPMISVAISFVGGLTINFALSKAFVFKGPSVRTTAAGEFIIFLITGVVGLGLTEIIMFVCCAMCCLHYILARIIATIAVLFWNYFSRKLLLYTS